MHSQSDKDLVMCAAGMVFTGIGLLENFVARNNKRKAPRWWVRPIMRRRSSMGAHNLLNEMLLHDQDSFLNYFRMSPKSFDKLLKDVGPHIIKSDNFRMSINPSTRLAMTLRYLASGDSQMSVAYNFRIGKSTTNKILLETMNAIWHCLHNKVLAMPSENTWKLSAAGFNNRWNFPHCIGAIDGKHIRIIAPPDSGSDYYNYKNYHSIILLAICDYRYRFIAIDIGAQGRQSDGGVFRNSIIGSRFAQNKINVPDAEEMFPGGPILPYWLLGDEAFGLRPWMLTPYPGKSKRKLEYHQQIFNYRQSRARRVIENAFGIAVAKWRILKNSLNVKVETAEIIVKAVICLHNFCLIEEEHISQHQKSYLTPNIVDREVDGVLIEGDWNYCTDKLNKMSPENLKNPAVIATSYRNDLAEHFMTDGSIPWQWDRPD